MKLTRQHVIIIIIQITEVLGFSLILPFLPFYAKEFGASPFTIGLILTSFSLLQFISAPIMGRLSDTYGRRPLLILSQVSTMLSFIVLGFANSLWLIFLSRAIDGMLGSNFTIAQAYLSDISSKKDRSKVFGLSGMAFGIGFLIGPAIGGYLSQFSYSIPAFLAAGMSLITILTTYLFLPETVTKSKTKKFTITILDISAFTKYFTNPKIATYMLQLFLYMFAHITFTSTFAMFADIQLGLNSTQVGYFLAFLGLASIIIRGGLIPKLIDTLGEHRLMITGLTAMISSLIATSFITNWQWLLFTIVLFGYGSGVLRPLLVGAISKQGSDSEQGALLGVSNSLVSIAQILGPLVGGFVLSTLPSYILPLVSMTLLIPAFFLVMRNSKA